ncbi:MAG: hypothetical protein GF329_16790 [Candidatus Lokiarchaeota archaeon]|nr:hypothetical protein [Candidatus Lokiarchaeota archaeon]
MAFSFDDLFKPKSIAIVGASKRLNFGSAFFIHALKVLDYEGKVYYINPKYKGDKLFGRTIIGSLDEIDHKVDLVYSCVPARIVPEITGQCARREDKFLVVFTSGFSELLTEDAVELENKLLNIIKNSSTRIIGPNCLGPYCPKGRVGWDTGFPPPKRPGNVAFASQSGGHASNLIRVASGRGFYYSKGLSFGNQIDINCLDMLEYYASTPDSKVIAFYLESTGSADGNEFFKKLNEITLKKPVVIWKGGQTETGTRAAASHTGAISGSLKIWKSMINQAGGIFVKDSEEFWDMIHLLAILVEDRQIEKVGKIERIGLITPGGGNSVEMTDIFTRNGLKIPVLSQITQEKLEELLPPVNTAVKNPIDLGAVGLIERVFISCCKYIDKDPNIDVIVNFQPIDWLVRADENFGSVGYVRSVARTFGRLVRKRKNNERKIEKPIIQVSPNFNLEEKVGKQYPEYLEILRSKHVPVFTSTKRLAKSLKLYNLYIEYLLNNKS